MASAMGALASAPCAASRLGLPRRLPTRPPLPGPLTWVRRAAPAPKATAVSQHLLGAAVKVAALVPDLAASAGSSLAAAIDLGVLGATINASAKLFLICAAVGWLLRSGRIPNSTSTVLSKVSFEILIPAMLFTKVASTLAAQPDSTLLLGIAAAAVIQICIGAACGLALTSLLGLHTEAQQQQRDGSKGGGWQGRTSPSAASAIAMSLSTASGAPSAAAALRPRPPGPPAGPAALAVPASAAFGNSFALPAVFLTTLLPKAVADRALGYAALFLLAWSPCLWSIGLALVSGQQGQALRAPQLGNGGGGQALGASRQEHLQQADETVARRPLYWREPRVVDITPLTAQSNSTGKDDKLALPEPPGWAEKLAVHPTTAKLCQFAAQVLNPPVVAILFGMLVGLTPAGRLLIAASSSPGVSAGAGAASVAALPPELGLLQACARVALEVVELLAQGTLAIQTLALGASLLQQPEARVAAASVGPASVATAAAAGARHRRGWLGALKQLLPADSAEGRALAILALTRFLLVPLATVGALQALVAGGLLPPVLADPVLLFVLLMEACMPSAQNLIILLQLSERTQALAPGFARMLLKHYCYAAIPVTLWLTAFATNLGIPILR